MLTLLEIRKKEFRRRFRGYDKQEVESFLDQVSSSWEQLVQENTKLREQVERSEDDMARFREIEEALKQTMVFTQKKIVHEANQKAEQIISEAQRRAGDILRETQQQAEQAISQAHQRVDQLLQEYRQMERQLKVFRVKFRSSLEAQLKLLEDGEFGMPKEVSAVNRGYDRNEDEDEEGDKHNEAEGEELEWKLNAQPQKMATIPVQNTKTRALK